MSAKAIKAILDNAPELRPLTEQSRHLLHIQQVVRAMLPDGMASQVSVGCFDSGTLTLTSASGAAAAKLRQLKPRLLKQLRRDERELNSIKIVVQVGTNPNPLPTKRISLGPTARNALLTLSSRLDSPSLRAAVVQLARRNAPLNCKQETLEEIDSNKNQSDSKTNT
ncbi:MAG: DUF721 domain-containing protein [Betaproteobacteria bacterium]|nr:MAG: DUF721 domain-containing protein [Betaproteobacteria bacterium]